MNKKELAAAVAERCSLSQADAVAALDATLDVIGESLAKSEEVRLLGFGSFTVTERPAGKRRNPQTQEEIEVKAARVPRFKPGKGLKELVDA